ncbi:ABC transporter substrate-binding protein [Amycolatopsis antarctica]|uniref:ABC transporter substrate-binding protein n=1 Tax=Amycolatopsis antarctica TaxID=1854586 RepID=A0A263CWJ7_9PSEU|nr:ABC transporter substrate-binding protein [Amycolatopsis antarctica]OZM70520.1 ABC transporter substrate-binding protein [Amycolatopsis antarctica]
MSGSRRPAPLALLAALLGVLALAGCATRDEQAPAPQADSAFPVQVQAEGAPAITVERRPQRIVSLSPAATETLYAVGAGEQVVAVDSASTFPADAPKSELSGLTLDPEAIAAKSPDLVVVSADLDGKLAAALGTTGIATLVLPDAPTLEAAYAQFALVGTATGHRAEGEDLARRTREDIDKIVADTPKPPAPLRYYHELDPSYYSVTSATFIGEVYGRFGLVNIADGGDPNAAGGYPQLSAETIVQANPSLIFLADGVCCGQTAETVAARPGWAAIDAVRDGGVVTVNDDIASRWSPRVTDFARAVSDAVAGA